MVLRRFRVDFDPFKLYMLKYAVIGFCPQQTGNHSGKKCLTPGLKQA